MSNFEARVPTTLIASFAVSNRPPIPASLHRKNHRSPSTRQRAEDESHRTNLVAPARSHHAKLPVRKHRRIRRTGLRMVLQKMRPRNQSNRERSSRSLTPLSCGRTNLVSTVNCFPQETGTLTLQCDVASGSGESGGN